MSPRWNGQPCEAIRGTGVVLPAPEFVEYWARELIGQRVAVVQVRYHGATQYLYDDQGQGWWKVTEGRGGPGCGHKNLNVGDFQPAVAE